MSRSNKAKLIAISLLSALLVAGCSSNAADPAATAPGSASAASGQASSSGAAIAAAAQLASLDASEEAGFDEDDELTAWSADSATAIALSASGASVNGSGATAEVGVVTIAQAGTYVVSGTSSDGQLVVEAPEDAVVHLVLNGANITKKDGPGIYVKEADKTVVTLQEGTENAVTDGETYADTSEEAPTAAIFSKGDLTINGAGKLTVQGNANDGITSKDDLKIMSGTIDVKAADDGMIGRDLFAVKDGAITIEAGGDGIKSTNDDTDKDKDKGYVAIVGGTFKIASGNDGIQAATSLLIAGGTFDIVTGGGSAASTKTHQEDGPGGFGGGGRGFGGSPQGQVQGQDQGQAQPQDRPQDPPQDQTAGTEETESFSAKGLKAAANIAIADGKFTIDAADDSIHSNANIAIIGGEYSLSTGDDGTHADTALSISGGTIDIAKSYEGIESADIAISGGDIRVAASDDGVNVSGGNDGSGAGGPGGGGDMFSATDGALTISGGYLYVNASGDGLDSNGSMVMTGGTAIVNGPTNDGNGPLDYNGTFEQSGGTLIAAGSAGMAQAPSEDSTQRALMMTFTSTLEAGTLVTVTDSSGKAVATFAPAKTFRSVVVSSPDLKAGESYTISTGGKSSGTEKDGWYDGGSTTGSTKVVTFTLGDSVTYVNESGVTTANTGGGPGGGRGPGGGGGGQGRPSGGKGTGGQSGGSNGTSSGDAGSQG